MPVNTDWGTHRILYTDLNNKQEMMRTLLTGMAAFVIFSGCSSTGDDTSQNEPVQLPVIRLQQLDTTINKYYVASIQAHRNVELRAKVAGYIDRILVDEGHEVKKGQLLFTLNPAEYETNLARANASLANALAEARSAELDLQRVKMLVEKEVISKTESELAEARLKSAEAKVAECQSEKRNASIRISYTEIRAPFDGIIDRIPFKVGSLVNEGSLLTTVSDLSSIYTYFNVSENEYLQYVRALNDDSDNKEREVKLQLADGSQYSETGIIETMESEFDAATGSIAFRARFPNPKKMLKHGASGKVSLETEVNDAFIVPMKSVFEIQDKNYVFVVEKDSTVKMKIFQPDLKMDEYVIVKEGLSDEYTIVYEGLQNIKEGTRISPKPVAIDNITLAANTN